MPKRTIPRALFEPFAGIRASDLEGNEPLTNLIKKETPLAIEEAFNAKKTFATIFEINTTGHYLDIPKMYWIQALEECIKLYIVEERFEECISINNLIEKIKKASKKTIKTNSNGERANRDSTSNQ